MMIKQLLQSQALLEIGAGFNLLEELATGRIRQNLLEIRNNFKFLQLPLNAM
jgi:predicted nuclease of restriction endonuclease-like (RecB) superfamily